jgi:hypothetical protein
MQHFHEEKILSTYNTKAAQKRRERAAKTQELLESFDALRETDDIIEARKEKALKESMYQTFATRRQMERNNTYELNQKNNYINEQIDNLARDLFFYTVYESLLVDEPIKNANYQYIREHTNEFYDLCNKNQMISVKEDSGFDDILQTGIYMLKEELIDNNSCDLGRVLQETVEKENFLTFYAIESIKFKTAESLKNEKQASILKEQLISEDKYVDPSKSLFRYLFENNIRDTIDKTNVTEPESLQDMAMLETILDYTIMEAANTLQLVEFTNLKSICNSKSN